MNLYSVGFNSSCSVFKKHYNVILINQEMCWCTACCIYGVKGPQQKGESFIFVIISSTFLQTTDVHKVDICVLAYHLHIKCSSALTSWGWGGCWLSNGRSSSHTAGYLSVCLANQNWHFFFFSREVELFPFWQNWYSEPNCDIFWTPTQRVFVPKPWPEHEHRVVTREN